MNEKLFGKKLKLNDFNMTYGAKEKNMNVISFFKYLKDNSLYAIYCDDSNISYGIINYGTAHVKGNTLIIIGSKDPKQEMVKEIVFKIHNGEKLDGFAIQDLSAIETMELASPNKFEIKKEVLESLVDKTIPKPVIAEEAESKTPKKKHRFLKFILFLLILAAIVYFFFFYGNQTGQEKTVKSIICTKEYSNTELEATVIEDNTYNFNQSDYLEYINKSTTYRFNSEDDYLEFINKGLFWSYIPEDNEGYTLDEEAYSFTVIEKEDTTEDYFLPTEYEDVLSYYKSDGYSCNEQIEE